MKPHSAPLLRYASAGKIAEAEFQQEVSVIVQLKNKQSVTLPWKTLPMHVTTLKVDKMSAIPVNLPDFWKPFFMADGTSNFVLKVMKPTEQSRSAFYCERGAWKFEGPEFLGEKHRHISISTCKRYISIVGEHNGKTLEPMLFQSTINSNRELKETRLSVYTLQGQMRPMLLPRIKLRYTYVHGSMGDQVGKPKIRALNSGVLAKELLGDQKPQKPPNKGQAGIF